MNLNPSISFFFYCTISSIVQIYDTETEKKFTKWSVINLRLHKNSTQSVSLATLTILDATLMTKTQGWYWLIQD